MSEFVTSAFTSSKRECVLMQEHVWLMIFSNLSFRAHNLPLLKKGIVVKFFVKEELEYIEKLMYMRLIVKGNTLIN